MGFKKNLSFLQSKSVNNANCFSSAKSLPRLDSTGDFCPQTPWGIDPKLKFLTPPLVTIIKLSWSNVPNAVFAYPKSRQVQKRRRLLDSAAFQGFQTSRSWRYRSEQHQVEHRRCFSKPYINNTQHNLITAWIFITRCYAKHDICYEHPDYRVSR